MDKVFLSVVIPSYNEMTNLQKGVLDKIANFLGKQKYSYEVIIVDDGSDDGSLEFVEKFAHENPHFSVLKNSHMGKAGSVTRGMLKARGTFRLFTDMDQATPIEEIEKLLPFIKNYDVIIGSRSSERRAAPLTRKVMALGMITLRRIFAGLPDLKDTQCGFKLFSKDSTEKILRKLNIIHNEFKKISGSSVTSGFDIELLLLASKMGFKIKEVPVNWLYVETRRVSPIRDSVDGIFSLFRIRLNIILGKYKNL